LHKTVDKLIKTILSIEDSLWELESSLSEDNKLDDTDKEDLLKAKELATSSRDLIISTLRSFAKRNK